MYTYFLLALVVLSGIITFFIFNPFAQIGDEANTETPALSEAATYQNDHYDFFFEYNDGASRYVLDEGAISRTDRTADLLHSVVLTHSESYPSSQGTEAQEGPETIQILVYRNTLNQSPFVWALENPQESNIGLALSEIEEAAVGGANAAHYLADGLYVSDTYIVAHGGYIYLLAGMRSDMEGQIAEDFNAVVRSFSFISSAEAI